MDDDLDDDLDICFALLASLLISPPRVFTREAGETFWELAEINFPKFRFAEPDRQTTRACAARQINQTVEKLEEEAIDSRRGIKNK